MKTQRLNLFIADNDPSEVESLSNYLENRFGEGIRISSFNNSADVLDQLDHNTHVVLLDYNLEGKHGGEVLQSIKRINPTTEVIMLSSHEDIGTAIESFRRGASEYVIKGENTFEKIGYTIFQILAYPIQLITREFKASKFVAIFFMTFVTIGIVVIISLLVFHFSRT